MKQARKALVLSGGSVKGAFQAGAIMAVLDSGFVPDMIYGISVGALNGAFICSEAGKDSLSNGVVSWKNIGQKLVDFWTDNIRRPSDIVNIRWLSAVVMNALFDSYNGLVDTAPLARLIRKHISLESLRAAPAGLQIGTTNLLDGTLTLVDPTSPIFNSYLLASASIPIVMPLTYIGGQPLADGGVREIAPLSPAIKSGATEICAITCQPERMPSSKFDAKNLIQLIERTFDVMTNAILDDDMDLASFINGVVREDRNAGNSLDTLKKYREIEIISIRPRQPLEISITSFSSDDIRDLVSAGYDAAIESLRGKSPE